MCRYRLNKYPLVINWSIKFEFSRYNKSLVGNDMGKFPAPLLMNTFHFGMQAVLAKAITWIWSSRFQPTVHMSWKDYFMRGYLNAVFCFVMYI